MAIQPSRLRITGLNSGMDTQSIVTSLMKLEQMKVDKQFRAVTRLQWKQDSYRQVNNLLRTFKDDYSTVTKQAQNMLSQINYRTNTVKLQKESNAVTMTAGSSALAGAGSVDYVAQLAKGESVASTTVANPADYNVNKSVGELFGDDIKYHYKNGQTGTFVFDKALHGTKSAEELKALVDQYNDPDQANPDGVNLESSPEYFSFSIGKNADGSDNTFTFNKDVSLSVVINAVNANSSANATLSFSQLTGQFTLTSKTTGETSNLEFGEVATPEASVSLSTRYQWEAEGEDGEAVRTALTGAESAGLAATQTVQQEAVASSNFFSAMGLDTGKTTNTTAGQNAILSINGIAIERTSNRFTADGITYTLNRTFNAKKKDESAGNLLNNFEALSEDGKMEYSVSQDVDSTFNMIKGYIDAYNTLIAKFNRGGETSTTGLALNEGKEPGLLNEKVNRAYEPLTDEERESLSEKQIEKWEALAKSGTLRNDAALSGLVSQLRSHFFSNSGDTGKNMTAIGLSTTANYQDGGQIQIDEAKLRKAIAENPEEVYQMFAGTGDVGGNVTDKGLVRKINDSINAYIKQNEQYTLSSNTEALRKADSRLTEMKNKLYNIEERYWAKFTAMEQALAKLNSQSGWLSAQLGSSSNG